MSEALQEIKQLRSLTQASIADCKEALKKSRYHLELAAQYLLHKDKITAAPIPKGYYAIDVYVEKLIEQVLEEMIARKEQFRLPIRKIKMYALDDHLPFDYVLLEDENGTHAIQVAVPTTLPASVSQTDGILLSFCLQQLEKEGREVTKVISWNSDEEVPRSLLWHEILTALPGLVQALLANGLVVEKDVLLVAGTHENEYRATADFFKYSLADVTAIFSHVASQRRFFEICYKKVPLVFLAG